MRGPAGGGARRARVPHRPRPCPGRLRVRRRGRTRASSARATTRPTSRTRSRWPGCSTRRGATTRSSSRRRSSTTSSRTPTTRSTRSRSAFGAGVGESRRSDDRGQDDRALRARARSTTATRSRPAASARPRRSTPPTSSRTCATCARSTRSIGEAAAARFKAPLDVRVRLWRGDVEMLERVAPELRLLARAALRARRVRGRARDDRVIVDCAHYRDGERQHEGPLRARGGRELLRRRRRVRLARAEGAERRGARAGRRDVRAARAGARGRRRRPPAAEARGLRRLALHRPAHRPLRRREGGGRVRRDPRLRRRPGT